MQNFLAEIPDSKLIKSTPVIPLGLRPIPEIRVGELPIEISEAYKLRAMKSPTPLKIGEGRRILETETTEKMAMNWTWERLTDGSHVAYIRFTSDGAIGVRLQLGIENIDPRTKFMFYGSSVHEATVVSGFEVIDTVFKNLTERPSHSSSRTYVSPYISGTVVTFGMHLPKGISPETQRIAIPALSRINVSPEVPDQFQKLGSGSCHFDIKCEPGWDDISRGVARMVFTDVSTATSYLCTGSLLNDTIYSVTPYFLSANHCIDTQ
jgi:hypothetical protein